MKKWSIILCLVLALAAGLWIAKGTAERATQKIQLAREQTEEPTAVTAAVTADVPTTLPTQPVTIPTEPETQPTTIPTEPETQPTAAPAYTFTEEEERLLLKIGMAERGDTGCTECIALVMRTVLNRVESSRFPSTIKGVIYAQDQFTPVMDGTFESAVPGERCREALEMIKAGWDESQGALYYEWCQGESWHSRNLKLLLQHCDTRFYQ